MTDRRPLLRAIYDAAVAAAHPDVVLERHLRPVPKGKVMCLAAGKGAAAMAAAAERHYLDAIELDPARLSGIATTRHGHGVPTRRIRVVEAGHPMPDEAGLKAAEETLRLAQTAEEEDLLLVLDAGEDAVVGVAAVLARAGVDQRLGAVEVMDARFQVERFGVRAERRHAAHRAR